jgi:hypothetical protein
MHGLHQRGDHCTGPSVQFLHGVHGLHRVYQVVHQRVLHQLHEVHLAVESETLAIGSSPARRAPGSPGRGGMRLSFEPPR